MSLLPDSLNRLVYPLLFLLVVVSAYSYVSRTGIDPAVFALHPLDLGQWWGIVTSVFVHANAEHLLNNVFSLTGLLALLFFSYDKVAVRAFFLNWLFSGIIMFLFARSEYFHMGASAFAYAVTFFLFAAGLLAGSRRMRVISLLVAVYYGGMIWGLFPLDPKVSWDGHMCGAAAGVLVAFMLRRDYQVTKEEHNLPDWMEHDDPAMDEYERFNRRNHRF